MLEPEDAKTVKSSIAFYMSVGGGGGLVNKFRFTVPLKFYDALCSCGE